MKLETAIMCSMMSLAFLTVVMEKLCLLQDGESKGSG